MLESGWNSARDFTIKMGEILLNLNEERIQNGKDTHKISSFYFHGKTPTFTMTNFTDDFDDFKNTLLDDFDYENVKNGHTNTPSAFIHADQMLHDLAATTKSFILITDGDPYKAEGVCNNQESFIGSEDQFTPLNQLACPDACQKTTNCDGSQKANSCSCTVHVAQRFNEIPHYSTTVVGVPDGFNPDGDYSNVFTALATSDSMYIDASNTDNLDEFIDSTLLSTCRTPYHKCLRAYEWPNDTFEHFDKPNLQKSSWAYGCEKAEEENDVSDECYIACETNDEVSHQICDSACEYYYNL
jgi:hypothetical protein